MWLYNELSLSEVSYLEAFGFMHGVGMIQAFGKVILHISRIMSGSSCKVFRASHKRQMNSSAAAVAAAFTNDAQSIREYTSSDYSCTTKLWGSGRLYSLR